MAYVLGFFAADGSMISNNRGAHFIEFMSTDKELIILVKECLESGHKITTRIRNPKHKPSHRIQIGSKSMFNDLQRLGFCQAKSLVLSWPKIPKKYQPDFVRGYFDGDGGVYFKRYLCKDRKNPRWVFMSRFTSGSLGFLKSLHQILKKDANVNGGFIVTKAKQKGFDLVFSHHDSVALYWYMYHNAPRIYLKRKYSMFQKALTTLYGETMRS